MNSFFFYLKVLNAFFLLSFHPKIELSDNLFRVGWPHAILSKSSNLEKE